MARLSADELIDGGDVTTPVSTVQTDYGNRGMYDSVIPATGTSAADLAAAINYSPESAAVASAGAKQPDVVVDLYAINLLNQMLQQASSISGLVAQILANGNFILPHKDQLADLRVDQLIQQLVQQLRQQKQQDQLMLHHQQIKMLFSCLRQHLLVTA